jgi:hypothetical protein
VFCRVCFQWRSPPSSSNKTSDCVLSHGFRYQVDHPPDDGAAPDEGGGGGGDAGLPAAVHLAGAPVAGAPAALDGVQENAVKKGMLLAHLSTMVDPKAPVFMSMQFKPGTLRRLRDVLAQHCCGVEQKVGRTWRQLSSWIPPGFLPQRILVSGFLELYFKNLEARTNFG